MDWLGEKVAKAFWSILFGLAKDIADKAFKLITDFILTDTDMNKYFNISSYLNYSYILAGGLLIVATAWEAFKQQTMNVLPGEEKTLGRLMGQSVVAGMSIYFLPWSVSNLFIRLNNLLIKAITYKGISIDNTEIYKKIGAYESVEKLGYTFTIMFLVIAVAFFILGIASAIRYIDLVINVILAPIIAVSAVRNYEALNIWVREMVAVVFTQIIHILLLQVLMYIMLNQEGLIMYMLSIGIIVVMMRGPKVLRQFLYSAGVGSAAVNAAGSAGRMAAQKIMFNTMIKG